MALSVTVSSITKTSFRARVQTSGAVPMQHNWYLDGALCDTVQTAEGEMSSSCSFSGLDPGTTYDVMVAVYAFNPWRELARGSRSVTTEEEPRPVRPNDWSWWSAVSAGRAMKLTASEWNAFLSRVQEFADYKGVSLSSSSLSSAIAARGTTMRASQANAARSLVNQLSPRVGVPYAVSAGDAITASFINGLKDALNSVW